jgi:hypothetical protein
MVIISKNFRISGEKLAKSFRFRKLVLDSSNDFRTRSFWISEAERINIPVHDITSSGAFILNSE